MIKMIDKYEIIEKRAIGGMAVVYKALHTDLKKYVAIKEISHALHHEKRYVDKFLEEARVLAQISHPNVMIIHDLLRIDDSLYIVMEFLDKSLLEVIKQGPTPSGVAIKYIDDIAGGLEAVHNAGIVHRDIKPSNIMLNKEGKAKICDFGIAKRMGEDFTMQLSTAKYMAPELFHGVTVDIRMDIYSLGFVAYELLLGEQRFRQEFKEIYALANIEEQRWLNWHSDWKKKTRSLYEIDSNIWPQLSDVVNRMLQKERDRRYSDARSLREDLARVQKWVSAEPEPPVIPAKGWADPGMEKLNRAKPGLVIPKRQKVSPKAWLAAFAGVITALVIFFYVSASLNRGKEFNKLVQLAEADFKDFQYDDCVKTAEQALQLEKDVAKSAKVQALLDQAKTRFEAQKFFKAAQDNLKQGKYDQALQMIGNAHQRAMDDDDIGKMQNKIENLKAINVMNASSKSVAAWNQLADETNDLDEQIAYFRKALQREPGHWGTAFRLGYAYFSKEEYEKALQQFNAIPSDNPWGYMARIDLYLAQSKNKEAQNQAQFLLKQITGYREQFQSLIRFNVGRIYYNQKLYENARKEFSRAIELDSENIQAYVALGGLYYEQKEYQNALREYQNALRRMKEDNDAQLHLRLASAYGKMGEQYIDKTLQEYRKALDLAPDDDAVLNAYAYSLSEHNQNLDEAERLMRKAIQIKQHDRERLFYYLDSLGWIYYKQGHIELALKRIKKSATLADLTDTNIFEPLAEEYLHLEEIYGKLKQTALGTECYRMVIDLDTETGDLAKKADSLRSQYSLARQ